ncbi:hypothetical protein [Lunatimonas salinarum]|uniref:hypothetical protein n=1 Tax=Lunatimonas salinarum TaxID=1774590 RepID=UPI001AE0C6A2|nr:hypothetical protein [Lunatimonas salinarum]
MLPYVLPFRYLYASRFTCFSELLSLLWIYPLFLGFLIFGLYGVPQFPTVWGFVIGFGAWIAIYEIGYMENDVFATGRERFPTYRLDAARMAYAKAHFGRIVTSRVLLFALLLGINWGAGLWSSAQAAWFVAWVLGSRLFFVLHNRIRSRANIATYFGLCLGKYTVFPFLYLGVEYGWQPYGVVMLCFVLLRTTEHAAKEKYGLVRFQQWVGDLDTFRVIYYSSAFAMAMLGWLMGTVSFVFPAALAYFLVFRGAIWLLLRWGTYTRPPL